MFMMMQELRQKYLFDMNMSVQIKKTKMQSYPKKGTIY